MATDCKALCAEILKTLDDYEDGLRVDWDDWRVRARAHLSQPEPEGPTESDLSVLFYRHVGEGSEVGFEDAIKEVLARWGRPAVQPIPVSERPWEREGWCDNNGWCWCFDADGTDEYWSFDRPEPWACWTHVLPHYALPIPTTTQESK